MTRHLTDIGVKVGQHELLGRPPVYYIKCLKTLYVRDTIYGSGFKCHKKNLCLVCICARRTTYTHLLLDNFFVCGYYENIGSVLKL